MSATNQEIRGEILKILEKGPCSVNGILKKLGASYGEDEWNVLLAVDQLSGAGSKRSPIDPVILKAIKRSAEDINDRAVFYLASQEEKLVEAGLLSREAREPMDVIALGTPEQINSIRPLGGAGRRSGRKESR